MQDLLQRFRNTSISHKLTIIIVATSCIVLLLASTAFVSYGLVTFRRQMVRNLTVQAQIIGRNTSTSLGVNDLRVTTEVLTALEAEPSIVLAYIIDMDNGILSKYIRQYAEESPLWPIPKTPGYEFTSEYLHLYQYIYIDEKPMGMIYIQTNLKSLYTRLYRYIAIAGVV